MNIKQVEQQTGMTRANIRYYEAEGLIRPQRRENGYREYTQEDVRTLQKIRLLRSMDISLEEIATRFHMSPKYFSRYFHTTFRITLSDYINRLRLDLAINLLENTDLTITEIALQCGYSSCSYFNKRFKEIYQISPSTYRKDPGVLQRGSNTTSN